jgi:hypothetical protein
MRIECCDSRIRLVTIRKYGTIRTMSLRNSRLCSREEYRAEMLLPRLPPQRQKAPCMHHGASLGQRFAYALRSGNCHAPYSVLPQAVVYTRDSQRRQRLARIIVAEPLLQRKLVSSCFEP